MSVAAASSAALRRPTAAKPSSSSWSAPSSSSRTSAAQAHPRRLASTAAWTQDAAPSTSSSSRPRAVPASSLSSQGFFIPSPSSPAASYGRSARRAWKRARPPYHPLVNELLTEVYSPHVSSERVWSAYTRLHTVQVSGSSSHIERPMNQLTAAHHQLVLRAIAPDAKRVREAKRRQRRILASSLSSEPTQPSSSSSAKFQFPSGYMSKRVQPRYRPTDPERYHLSAEEYISRVRFIFQQMRGAVDAHLAPDLSDYNHVLQKLAAGGHLASISRIWAHLTGRSRDVMGSDGSEGTEAWSDFQPPAPSIDTYQSLMLAVSKQLSASLERHQKALDLDAKVRAEKSGVARRGGSRAAALQSHLETSAARHMQARRAAILAAQRALGLIEHMQDRGIKADAMTLDLAMRTLRLAGQLESIKALLHAEYAVNLDTADAPLTSPREAEKRQSVSIHTLNTLLMALGEQATVSEMLAAYETISKPLPVRRSDLDEDDALGFDDRVQPPAQPASQEQNQSLFTTNFKGLFDNDPLPSEGEEVSSASSADSIANLAAETDPLRPEPISPNVRTFRTLLRHSLAPAHAATQLKNGLGPFSRSIATAEEDERRARGAYLPVAKYVVREAVERYEGEVKRMATDLGVAVHLELPSAEEIAEAQKEAALDVEEGEEAEVVIPSHHISTSLSSDISPDFKPHFDPPATGLVPADLRPLTSFASRSRNVADLAWCASWLDRLVAARKMEIAAVRAAHKLWYPLVNGTEANWAELSSHLPEGCEMPTLSPDLVQPLLDALNSQERMSRGQLREMEDFRVSVAQRLRALRAQRKERIRRRERNRLGAKEAEIKEARKREEEKRIRALLKEEEARRAAEEKASPREAGNGVEQLAQGQEQTDKDAALRFSPA